MSVNDITKPNSDNNDHIDIAASRLAELLVAAIDEKYAKKRKKAKSPSSPSKLSTGN